MRTVYLITTGGTIEKSYSEDSGAVLNKTSKVGEYLRLLRLSACEKKMIPLINKDSLEMSYEDRAWLAKELALLLPNEHPVVITHGTDTMVETGVYLKGEFPSLKVPVILTGAMSPLGFEGSDGLQNLTESLFATQLLDPGVSIVFHGQVFPVDGVHKDKELGTFVANRVPTGE